MLFTDYIVSCTRNVMMRQGVLGVKVSIMLPYDPSGVDGPSVPLSDTVIVKPPKEDVVPVVEEAVAPPAPPVASLEGAEVFVPAKPEA